MADQDANLEKIDAVFLTKTTLQSDSVSTDRWTVREFWIKETIARPYHGTVDIVTSSKSIDFSKLLGKSCILRISRGAKRERFFKGIVSRIEILGVQNGRSAAKINFAPALHALEYGKNTRIFADKTGPEIIHEVLKEALAPFDRQVKMQCLRKYALREYTVQYKESDFNFISRLMVDEGLTSYFDQTGETETVVVVDSNEAHVEIDTMGEKIVPAEPVVQGLEEWATAGQTALDASNFVEIELKDECGKPVPNAKCILKMPNGRPFDYELNQDGWLCVPIAKQTACKITFPELDATQWGPKGQQGKGRGEPSGEGGKEYVVKQGDCLSSIAFAHGVQWEVIWKNSRNKDLRELRKNPNILFPGDRVYVPEKDFRWEDCSIRGKNIFTRKKAIVTLEYYLKADDGAPLSGATFALEVDGDVASASGSANHDGLVKCDIPADSKNAILKVEIDGEKRVYHIQLGYLDPVSTISGVQARLIGLGLLQAERTGQLDSSTMHAISRFQEQQGLEISGEPDAATQEALAKLYGCQK